MTTDYQCFHTDDVTHTNRVYNLEKSKVPKGFTVSAMAWIKSGRYDEREDLGILDYVISLLNGARKENDIWLCVSNSAWQPDNRIERHKRLWNRIKKAGLKIPEYVETLEEIKERPGEVRFFGALKISGHGLEKSLFEIMEWDGGSFILISKKGSKINELIRHGWENLNFPEDFVLRFVCWSDAIILRRYGEFEAFDRGYVAIGNAKEISLLLGEHKSAG